MEIIRETLKSRKPYKPSPSLFKETPNQGIASYKKIQMKETLPEQISLILGFEYVDAMVVLSRDIIHIIIHSACSTATVIHE